jgi:hypothetical protein
MATNLVKGISSILETIDIHKHLMSDDLHSFDYISLKSAGWLLVNGKEPE